MELIKVGKDASMPKQFHYSLTQNNDNKQVSKNYKWWLSLLRRVCLFQKSISGKLFYRSD